jgi:hypothetical protein
VAPQNYDGSSSGSYQATGIGGKDDKASNAV